MIGAVNLVAPPNTDLSFPGVGPVNRAGRTEHFEVLYDRVLGETGRFAGAVVLNRAERDLAAIREWFGDLAWRSEAFQIVLARRPEDARAALCPDPSGERVTILCDVQTTPRLDALQTAFFVSLALADVLAAAAGWDSRLAGALARVLATALYPTRIIGFATAWLWLESDRDDFVTVALPSTPTAAGCAVLFLNYLHHQLGFAWQEIAKTPATTLGEVGHRLTASGGDFAAFRSLLAEHLPIGEPSSLPTDNPFPLDDGPGPLVSR